VVLELQVRVMLEEPLSSTVLLAVAAAEPAALLWVLTI
jgi:hypothetical protein